MVFLQDVIVVGAGPCGLALATRFCERTPAENYTDEEHRRYHWIRKSSAASSPRHGCNLCNGASSVDMSGKDNESEIGQQLGDYHTLIIDATSDRFLSRWKKLFETFDICHLRSPMFFHIDPADRDGLLAYAQRNARYRVECEEIRGVVGQELSKHTRKQRSSRHHKHQAIGKATNVEERERQDYFIPSRELFHDHCQSLINHYKIDEERLIVKDAVVNIDYGPTEEMVESGESFENADKIFKVMTTNGVHYGRAVVLAIGPSMPLEQIVTWPEGTCHSSQIKEFPSQSLQSKIDLKMVTNVLIIGGGLTSAQLALRAIKSGVSKVWLIMRGLLKIKHFDLSLEWVGKYKNHEKATFWSADTDQERFEMIKAARNGGSIPLKYKKLLDKEIARGRLAVLTHTSLEEIRDNHDDWNTRTIITEPPIPGLPLIDYVYFATGPRSALNSLALHSCCKTDCSLDKPETAIPVPFLRTMQQKYPIHWLNGLPILSNDLAWSLDEAGQDSRTIPLFMTGALAALRLGPGAANLEGARTGAERVTWAVQDMIGARPGKEQKLADGLDSYISGNGGMFDGLAELDSY